MPNSTAAKQSAAMKAAIKLYENGELTDHFVPLSAKKVLEDLNDEYFPHWSDFENGMFILFEHLYYFDLINIISLRFCQNSGNNKEL